MAVLLVGGLVALALLERTIPEGLLTLAGGVIGALSALLVSTRSGQDQPVPVVNAPGEALAVEDPDAVVMHRSPSRRRT